MTSGLITTILMQKKKDIGEIAEIKNTIKRMFTLGVCVRVCVCVCGLYLRIIVRSRICDR